MEPLATVTRARSRNVVVAWSLWAAACLVTLAAIVFVVVTPGLDPPYWGIRLATGLWAVSFASVGAVLATRVRTNPIGWLFLGAGVLASVLAAAGEVASATASVGSERADLAYWVVSWLWIPVVGAMAAAILLFPDGRPANRFWRGVLVALGAVGTIATITSVWVPTLDVAVRLDRGPLGDAPAWLEPVALPSLTAFQFMLVLVMSSLVVRFRGASGVRRWQLLWVAFAAAIVAVTALVTEFAYSLGLIPSSAYLLGSYVLSLVIALVPIAVGIAVMRYRLYEIERLINRTVVYTLVTALLGALYFGVILVLQAAFTARTGELPDVAIAGTTLLAAAAFSPVRRRVHDFVARRFNRSHADAVRLVDGFAADLRREVDHEVVAGLLLGVARASVQPSTAGLWVQPDAADPAAPPPPR